MMVIATKVSLGGKRERAPERGEGMRCVEGEGQRKTKEGEGGEK